MGTVPGINIASLVSSKKPSKHGQDHDVPERVKTVDEEYVSDRNAIPYRGTVDHGVNLQNIKYNEDLTAERLNKDDADKYAQHIEPVTPVPVYIVHDEESAESLRMFRAGVVYAKPSDPQSIVGRHDARTKITIKNLDAAVVWIGHDTGSAQVGFGWPLAQNETREFTSTQAIFASTSGVNPAQVAYIAEYSAIIP